MKQVVLGILLFVLLFVPAGLHAQIGSSVEPDTARISASAYAETSQGTRSAARFAIDLVRVLPGRGTISASSALVNEGTNLHAGTSFMRWQAPGIANDGSAITAGAFMYQPQLFENRAGNVYVPALLMRGVDSRWSAGRLSINAFAGRSLVEEGSRLLYMRGAGDRIAGATAALSITPRLSFAFQAAKTTSPVSAANTIRAEWAPASSVQLRQGLQWKVAKSVVFDGEFAVAKAGGRSTPSFHAGLEHESSRFNLRAAYVRRGAQYLPLGLMAFSADRQGPYAEVRYRVTSWLDIGGSGTRLRTNLESRPDLQTTNSLQYNGNASIHLPANTQLSISHSQSRLKFRGAISSGHAMTLDSATLVRSARRWVSRLRLEQIAMNSGSATRTRGLEFEETRIFGNGMSVGGQVRLQKTGDAASRALRLSTAVRGGYAWGNRVSVNVHTELGRDIRNQTLFATTNLTTSSASFTARLTSSSELRFEYAGSRTNYELNPESILAGALLGNAVRPVLGRADRNVFFVQFQKTIQWGSPARTDFASAATGVSVIRPKGILSGRVFVDENEDEIWNEGEAGAPGVIVVLNDLRQATTDADGRYEFNEAPVGPGEVALKVDSVSAVYTPVVLAHTVEVPFKARAEKNFALTGSSSIAGRIVGKDGEVVTPIADAAIRLEPGGLYAYTDAAGEFSISNVPRGRYELVVVPETLDERLQVISRPAEPVLVVHAGQQLKGFEFVFGRTERPAPLIERLPPVRVIVSAR